jgi:MFS family permease
MFTCTGITFSSAGIFFTAVCETLKVGMGEFAIWMTVAMIVAFIFLPFAGKLFAKMDARIILSAAVVLMGGSLMAFSLFTSVFAFYVAGVFIGLAMAVTSYLAVPVLLNRWFKTRVGFFLGICTAFSGVGGVVFNPIADWLIGTYSWQTAYLVLGIVLLVLTLPLTLFCVRSFPSDKGLEPYGAVAEGTDGSAAVAPVLGVSASVAQRSLGFFLLLLFTALVGFGVGLNTYLAPYARQLPLAAAMPTAAATLASAAMLGQAVGKIALGFINDRSIYAGLVIAMVSGAAGFIMLWLVPVNLPIILVAGFLFGIFYASALVQVPLMARTMFGSRDYAAIYSKVSMVSVLLSAFGVSGWGFIYGGFGSYEICWIGGILVVALCLLLGFTALAQGKRLKKTAE